MDYPNSVPSAGLVDGKFVDENPITGTPGSLIPASWGNGVTLELFKVIEAAGIKPSEASNDQLLTALRSNKLFVTAPQFDSDQSVATTEFVTRSGLQFSGFNVFPASATLTAANVMGARSATSTLRPSPAPMATSVTRSIPVATLNNGALAPRMPMAMSISLSRSRSRWLFLRSLPPMWAATGRWSSWLWAPGPNRAAA
nr:MULTISPECIES: hypothetical protein [Pseudomonas]